jgi:hypothetical protein
VVSALAFNLSLFLDELEQAPKTAEPIESAFPDAPPAPVVATVDAAPRVATVDSTPLSPNVAAAPGWKVGPTGGVLLRSGLGPGTDLNGRLAIVITAAGPPRAGYELGLELGGSLSAARQRSALANVDWDHSWWSLGASACPWGYAPLPWLGLAPCLAARAGRYQARVLSQSARGLTFAWLEPALQVRVGTGFFARWELGVTLPIAPLRVDIDGLEVFRQRLGFSTGVNLGLLFPGPSW